MNPMAHARLVLARRPWLYWLVVAAVATAAALVVGDAAAGIDEARRSWGTTRAVVVATADVSPGDPLEGLVEVRHHPTPMVPVAALAGVAPGTVARQHVTAGEVLVAPDVAAGSPPVSLIPEGWRAVAVAEAVPTGTAIGDHVAAASGGSVLAPDGLVVGRNGEAVLVAVPEREAAEVARAASSGELTLLLKP